MSILVGMQLGGQNPFSTFTKTCFLILSPCHLHFFLNSANNCLAYSVPEVFCNVGDRIKAIKHCLHHAWTGRQPYALPINLPQKEREGWKKRERDRNSKIITTNVAPLSHLPPLCVQSVLHCSNYIILLFCMYSLWLLQWQWQLICTQIL